MESKAKILGHPAHPMLIVYPLALLSTAFIFDIVYLVSDDGFWARAAYWMIAVGIIGGLLAAVFGLIDYLGIPRGTRAKYVGTLHGVGNVVVVALFAASWLLRAPAPADPPFTAFLFSLLGVLLSLVTGWLGGELVDRLGVGVDDGANLNAPSSLSGRPAVDTRETVEHRAGTAT